MLPGAPAAITALFVAIVGAMLVLSVAPLARLLHGVSRRQGRRWR
ncbi:MAG TPA: hypothetical protein VFT36_04450 [Methylomirabilota bacterium]|nr:hypothetical protein [Methylomirabilota bacterium]